MVETRRYAVDPESIEAYRIRVLFHCEELQRETNPYYASCDRSLFGRRCHDPRSPGSRRSAKSSLDSRPRLSPPGCCTNERVMELSGNQIQPLQNI